jgi:hypothetical protein
MQNQSLAEKLKLARLGSDEMLAFTFQGKEYKCRKLDWLEHIQIESEVKSMLGVDKVDYSKIDQWLFLKMSILNKGILVSAEDGEIPEWLQKCRDGEKGIEFLREFYIVYENTVSPEIKEKPDAAKK